MGALHEGHLALVRQARRECDMIVVSVFVNPTQFNDPDDLERYPQDLQGDRLKLEEEDVDVLFLPEQEEVYPEKEPKPPPVDISQLNSCMEGSYRPGHFEGVMMVLDRLFAMVRPHRAYFGEKDHQQLLVVRSLVELQGWGIEVMSVPIVRDSEGLALSSRNQKLSAGSRERASSIYATLCWMREQILSKGVTALENEAKERLQRGGMEVDYVQIADSDTLMPLSSVDPERPVKGFVAASIEGVRLIDNLTLNP